jgi:hypothetical protein
MSTEDKKDRRGGKRPGAGRPAFGGRTNRVAFKLSTAELEQLTQHANGESINVAARTLMLEALNHLPGFMSQMLQGMAEGMLSQDPETLARLNENPELMKEYITKQVMPAAVEAHAPPVDQALEGVRLAFGDQAEDVIAQINRQEESVREEIRESVERHLRIIKTVVRQKLTDP